MRSYSSLFSNQAQQTYSKMKAFVILCSALYISQVLALDSIDSATKNAKLASSTLGSSATQGTSQFNKLNKQGTEALKSGLNQYSGVTPQFTSGVNSLTSTLSRRDLTEQIDSATKNAKLASSTLGSSATQETSQFDKLNKQGTEALNSGLNQYSGVTPQFTSGVNSLTSTLSRRDLTEQIDSATKNAKSASSTLENSANQETEQFNKLYKQGTETIKNFKLSRRDFDEEISEEESNSGETSDDSVVGGVSGSFEDVETQISESNVALGSHGKPNGQIQYHQHGRPQHHNGPPGPPPPPPHGFHSGEHSFGGRPPRRGHGRRSHRGSEEIRGRGKFGKKHKLSSEEDD